jgi:hypothetical protein
MARYEPIGEWPGSIIYRAAHGRVYCAAPRGLIPDYPYSAVSLRQPTREEAGTWGPGVVPRMVLDVTDVVKHRGGLTVDTITVAPWNSYLVLCLPDSRVVVAYRTGGEIPRLDEAGAAQVAIAGGQDVGGWASELVRHFHGERWQFTPPRYEPMPEPLPELVLSRN